MTLQHRPRVNGELWDAVLMELLLDRDESATGGALPRRAGRAAPLAHRGPRGGPVSRSGARVRVARRGIGRAESTAGDHNESGHQDGSDQQAAKDQEESTCRHVVENGLLRSGE